MYELHYSTGGHGGPYLTLDGAIASARHLLGSEPPEPNWSGPYGRTIEVRRGAGGPLVWTVGWRQPEPPPMELRDWPNPAEAVRLG
jgi:hypothetical protein